MNQPATEKNLPLPFDQAFVDFIDSYVKALAWRPASLMRWKPISTRFSRHTTLKSPIDGHFSASRQKVATIFLFQPLK